MSLPEGDHRTMNVLRVIGSMDPALGGPGQGVRNTIPALEKLGVHNEVVSLDHPASGFLGNDPFTIHAIGPSVGPWQYGSKLIPWLLDNLNRFDVIVIEGLWLYYSHATGKAWRQFKERSASNEKIPKLLVMPHGMLDPYFQRDPSRRLKAVRNWIYWKLIESKVINHSDGLMFTCDEELQLARQPFRPYHPKNELNVGFGIQEPPPFQQIMEDEFFGACPEVRGYPYLLFLSRIHEKKGVDLLIHGYAKTFNANSPKLVIAGPGLDTPYGKSIRDLVSKYGLNGSVFFPGMLSGDRKWGAFYKCDAFILPSHQENFGIAVVEALACHKPVLISNQVNIWKEIIAEGAGIVADNTQAGAQSLIEKWIDMTPSERLAIVGRTRPAFEKLYAIDPAAERLLTTFRNTN